MISVWCVGTDAAAVSLYLFLLILLSRSSLFPPTLSIYLSPLSLSLPLNTSYLYIPYSLSLSLSLSLPLSMPLPLFPGCKQHQTLFILAQGPSPVRPEVLFSPHVPMTQFIPSTSKTPFIPPARKRNQQQHTSYQCWATAYWESWEFRLIQ